MERQLDRVDRFLDPRAVLEVALIALDPRTGSIIALVNKNTQRAWASPKNPLALFTYQTLGPEAYDAFIAAYLTVKTWWGPQDFGKPNIAAAALKPRLMSPVN